MKKNNLVYTFILLTTVFFAGISCKKLPDGFLSDYIGYEETPIVIKQGRNKVSSSLNTDGSSRFISAKLMHIYRVSDGQNMDSIFFKKYPVKGWRAVYNSKVDTTFELINAKLFDTMVSPIIVNERSGQIEANYATIYVPKGSYYFDLEISNNVGSKYYPKIGYFNIEESPTYETTPELGVNYVRLMPVGNENAGVNTLNCTFTLTRVADTPNIVTVKVVDKNNVPFKPGLGEVLRRPYPGLDPPQPYLQTLQDYSIKTIVEQDSMTFYFAILPFPYNSLGNGYNIYYRIPTQFFSWVNQTQYPNDMYSANIRFPLRVWVPGKYVGVFKANDMLHR